MKRKLFFETLKDAFFSILAGIVVALAFHIFASENGFAPGGIGGIASIISYYSGINMGYFLIILKQFIL